MSSSYLPARQLRFGQSPSFSRQCPPVLRSALAAVGGRSSLGSVWLFSPGRGVAAVCLGAARLSLAAGFSSVIEPPITIGGSWVVYVC